MIYGQPQTPLIEGQVIVKRNFSFGSLGVELGYGKYDNTASSIRAGVGARDPTVPSRASS